MTLILRGSARLIIDSAADGPPVSFSACSVKVWNLVDMAMHHHMIQATAPYGRTYLHSVAQHKMVGADL